MVGAWTRRLKRSALQAVRSFGGTGMCEILGIPSFIFAIASIIAGLLAGLIALIDNWSNRILAMRLGTLERDRRGILGAHMKSGLRMPSPLISSSEIVAADFRSWNRGRLWAAKLQAAMLGKLHNKGRSVAGLGPRKVTNDDGLLEPDLIERSFAEMKNFVATDPLDNQEAKRRSKILVAILLCAAAVFATLAALPCS